MAYSVVIPAYNATAYIGAALGSVFAQTLAPQEVIVVDDGSTDDLVGVLAGSGHQIRLIRQANSGPGAATTAGVAAAQCDLVATLDADDLWLPEKMEVQVAALMAGAEISAVFARMRSFHQDRPTFQVDDTASGWSRSTMVLRRAAFAKVGPMTDPPGRRGEVIDWIDRARKLQIKLEMLPQTLALRRLHADSLTARRTPESDRAYLQVAWQAIQRARAQKA